MKIDLTPLESIPKIENELKIISQKLDSNIDKRWLNTEELASYTGYKLETIKSKIKVNSFIRGVHYFKRDGKLLFDKFEVDKWVMGIQSSSFEIENDYVDIVDDVLATL